MLNQELKIMI